MLLGARDQHAQAAVQVYAVHEDHAVHLVHDVRHRPYRPEPGRRPAEAPALAGHVELAALAEQPGEEGLELAGRGVVAVRRAGPARPAPPSLPPGARLAVPLHRCPQDGHVFSFIGTSAQKMAFHGFYSA